MAVRSPYERLKDIATAMEKIERFLAQKTFEDFCSDALVHDYAISRNHFGGMQSCAIFLFYDPLLRG